MNVVPSVDYVELFELELQLPDARLDSLSKRLIGFETRYERIRGDLHLLSHPDDLREWSQTLGWSEQKYQKFHRVSL